jgi:hypothetical protein
MLTIRSILESEADMEHEMLLLDADFKPVARMVARRKQHAGMADMDMHLPRKQDYSGSTPDSSPTFDERVTR